MATRRENTSRPCFIYNVSDVLYMSDIDDRLSDICKLFANDIKISRPLMHREIDFNILQKDFDSFKRWWRRRVF